MIKRSTPPFIFLHLWVRKQICNSTLTSPMLYSNCCECWWRKTLYISFHWQSFVRCGNRKHQWSCIHRNAFSSVLCLIKKQQHLCKTWRIWNTLKTLIWWLQWTWKKTTHARWLSTFLNWNLHKDTLLYSVGSISVRSCQSSRCFDFKSLNPTVSTQDIYFKISRMFEIYREPTTRIPGLYHVRL